MKLDRAALERFLKAPDPAIAAVLVFGPDEGLARERRRALIAGVLGAADDPFRLAVIKGETLKAEPGRLIDEARAVPMLGGRRVLLLEEVGEGAAGALGTYLDAIADSTHALLIVEGGDLPGRSALKSLFESRRNAAAVPCYRDEAGDLQALIAQTLRAAGLGVEREALEHLAAHLGADRGVTRAELDKLILYMGAERQVTLAHARALIGDSAALELDELALAVAEGDAPAADRALSRSLAATSPILALRGVARHFLRLHQAAGRIAEGEAAETALAALRPPLFWKVRPRFAAQLRAWRPAAIGAALERLASLEAEAMRRHDLAEVVVRAGLLDLTVGAGSRRGSPGRPTAS